MAIDNRTNLKELSLGECLDIIQSLRKVSLTVDKIDRRHRLESLADKVENANAILLASSTGTAE